MIFLHTADIHADSPLTSKLPPEKARIRRGEILSSLRRMTEEAKKLGARVFVIAGDLFDSKNASRAALSEILRVIEDNPGICYLYLPGNHDGEDALSACSALPKNLYVFGKEWTYFRIDGVCFAGRSTLSPVMMSELSVTPSEKNVLVLHGGVADKSTTEVVGIKELVGRGVDYVALGHYHGYAHHKIDARCTAVYSGSPEARGFDEAHPCGFVVANTEGGRISHEFHPCSVRNVRIVPIDLTGIGTKSEAYDSIDRALSKIPSGDIVRLRLCGRRMADISIGFEPIFTKYRDRFFHLEAEDQSRDEISAEAYLNDRSLKGEFVRLTLSRNDLSHSDKERIIRAGLMALSGEIRDAEEI